MGDEEKFPKGSQATLCLMHLYGKHIDSDLSKFNFLFNRMGMKEYTAKHTHIYIYYIDTVIWIKFVFFKVYLSYGPVFQRNIPCKNNECAT